jgi:hypothetical protein
MFILSRRRSSTRGKVNTRFRMERITMTFKPTEAQDAELNTFLEQATGSVFAEFPPMDLSGRVCRSLWHQRERHESDCDVASQSGIHGGRAGAKSAGCDHLRGRPGQGRDGVSHPRIHEYVVDGKTFYANVNRAVRTGCLCRCRSGIPLVK